MTTPSGEATDTFLVKEKDGGVITEDKMHQIKAAILESAASSTATPAKAEPVRDEVLGHLRGSVQADTDVQVQSYDMLGQRPSLVITMQARIAHAAPGAARCAACGMALPRDIARSLTRCRCRRHCCADGRPARAAGGDDACDGQAGARNLQARARGWHGEGCNHSPAYASVRAAM